MNLFEYQDKLKEFKSFLINYMFAEKAMLKLDDSSFDRLSDETFKKFSDTVMSLSARVQDSLNIIEYLLNILNSEKVSPVSIEELEAMATLASEFDSSGDDVLISQAKLLDSAMETITTKIAEQENTKNLKKKYLEREIKEKYEQPREIISELNKTKDLSKKYSEKMKSKEYRPNQHALSTRYCPEHPGVGVIFLREGEYQCSLDKRIFNYKEGYSTLEGDKVPGGAVEFQNRNILNNISTTTNYDTRESRSQK